MLSCFAAAVGLRGNTKPLPTQFDTSTTLNSLGSPVGIVIVTLYGGTEPRLTRQLQGLVGACEKSYIRSRNMRHEALLVSDCRTPGEEFMMVHLFSEGGQFEPITIMLAVYVVARDGYFSQSATLTNLPHARIHSD